MTKYSNQKNVQVLVSLLKQHGVLTAVISPGSRNMPLVVSLENDPDFTCYSVVDERSAAYFAIGVSKSVNGPVLLSSTSAQATRNYIPGMTEAFYRGTPLVVVTADYKPSIIGQGVMQAIDQMSIPGDSAKYSVRLPVVKDGDDEKYCVRLANEALLALRHHGPGPVHIDLPTEEHWAGAVTTLPTFRKIDRYTLEDPFPEIGGRRVLIAVGQHDPFTPAEEDALAKFARAYDAPVYANHLSNYHGANAVHAALLVENMDQKNFAAYQPDILITIGGQIGDYGIDDRLKHGNFEHWRVNLDGKIQDTYGKLTKVFECSSSQFFERYAHNGAPRDSDFFDRWEKANARRVIPAELPLSHAYVAAHLAPQIPRGSVMHFAILSSLRNWNFFELDSSVECYSNVAAFGIDGCMSTFIGHSVASNELCYLVIGDLSFFYDMNALGIRHIGNNARIILINNQGGGEFRLYSHAADQFGEDANVHIAAAGHNGEAGDWARSVGWEYIGIRSKEEFDAAQDSLVRPSDRPMLMEVFTTMNDDSTGVRVVREANTIESLERRIARKLPPEVKRAAKAILGR